MMHKKPERRYGQQHLHFHLGSRTKIKKRRGKRGEDNPRPPPFPKAESEGWATRKIKSKIERSLRVGHPPSPMRPAPWRSDTATRFRFVFFGISGNAHPLNISPSRLRRF